MAEASKLPLRYVCYVQHAEDGVIRYDLFVKDVGRVENFAVGFALTAEDLDADGDARASLCARYERVLWAAIKKRSPGTFLDARALGWI